MTATAVVHHNHHHHNHHNHHQPPPPPPPQTQPQTQALTHPGSYLSITPSDTTRSNTPIKLPLQMPSAAATTTTTSTTTTVTTTTPPRSWLGDPDDVPLDNLRRSQQQQQQPQNPAPTLQLTPVAATAATHPSIGDEESRPPSHESEWNSTHPCYPHRNPYVPLDSALYASTRIIRISRDYMVYGDLAPAYSNVFPDILEPHVTEEQFRVVIARINAEMRRAFDPWNVWNWVDALVGLVTLWLWEEIVDTHCKRVLRGVEEYLEGRNREMERSGQKAVFVPLRRSGYMNLDIQIPDPIPATDEDEQEESKYLDGDASDTGSTIGPLGSEAGHQSLRMNSMNGRIGSSGRIGSMGSSSEGGYR